MFAYHFHDTRSVRTPPSRFPTTLNGKVRTPDIFKLRNVYLATLHIAMIQPPYLLRLWDVSRVIDAITEIERI